MNNLSLSAVASGTLPGRGRSVLTAKPPRNAGWGWRLVLGAFFFSALISAGDDLGRSGLPQTSRRGSFE